DNTIPMASVWDKSNLKLCEITYLQENSLTTDNLEVLANYFSLGGVSWWDYPLETVYSYVPNFSKTRE
ncbi:14733_t:CDS:2, partial [Funneliformis caledonium]